MNLLKIISLFLATYTTRCHGNEINASRTPSLNRTDYPDWNGPIRLAYPIKGIKHSARWLVIGSRKVIPGSVYYAVVQTIKSSNPDSKSAIEFRASLTWNQQQVSSGVETVSPGELTKILLKVPPSSGSGTWQLHVEGKEKHSLVSIFKNTTLLEFSTQVLTILIQASRPVYNGGQKVHFRAVLLDRHLKAHEEPVDVFVKDPLSRIMRRWPSRQPGDGVVNLNFELPTYPLLGNWTILVRSGHQVQEKRILVEQYFRPRFEVFVRLAQSFQTDAKWIEGFVIANMTNWRSVRGNCSLQLQLASNDNHPVPTRFKTVYNEFITNFTGAYAFRIPMAAVSRKITITDNVIVRVFATVGDYFNWQTQDGWALTKIFKPSIITRFLGDQPFIFKPGMPFTSYIFVSNADEHPVSRADMKNAVLIVRFKAAQVKPGPDDAVNVCFKCWPPTFESKTRRLVWQMSGYTVKIVVMEFNGTKLIENSGVIEASFMVPEEANSLEMNAKFTSSRGLTSVTSAQAIKFHSPRERYLHVDTSTQDAVPGEFIVLHVRNSFFITHFNYLVISNGLIVSCDREPVKEVSVPTITTFLLPASSDMAPIAKITVWAVDDKGDVVAHSLMVPINPLTRHSVSVRWNDHKDHTGGSAEVQMKGEKGSLFATSGIWEETYKMRAGHDLDEARVINQMIGFDQDTVRNNDPLDIVANIKRASTRSRHDYSSDIRLFSGSNIGPDVPTTLNFSEVVLLTDATVFYHPNRAAESKPCRNGTSPCLTGGCFSTQQRCDGHPDCPDGSDETGCYQNFDPDRYFRIYRINRLHRFYDPDEGDWGWFDIRTEGREIKEFSFPKRPQNWIFSMFAVGKERGFGLMKQTIQFDSAGPFTLKLEGPRVVRMWEQVGLTVGLFNHHRTTICVMVTLPYSPNYQMIMVEQNGIVESYDPRRGDGVFQHVVWLPGNSSTDVHIPIIFGRVGIVEVTVEGSTQMQKDSDSIKIEVIPEGALICKHTSILLDLKDRGHVYEFLDIHLDESPIIQYSLKRKYIFGTPKGSISVTGDVFGPAFPKIPVGASSLLGSAAMGAETSAYNFAANIWTLQYLRLTNQLTTTMTYKVLTAVNVEYAALSRYQTEAGGFSNWIGSEPCVWLTAHAIKNLWLANFQDWENVVYVDRKIIQKGVKWILLFQTEFGSFTETEHYLNPLDPKVDPRSRHDWMNKYQNVSLTAHVIITLCDVITSLEGPLHRRANLAKANAVSYLERILENLDDAYDLALVTWALIKANSKDKDLAFNKLDLIKRTSGNKIYWSREPISFNNLVYENNQRPYLQPKGDSKWDAHAVESTSYALLAYIKRDGIGIVQENSVRFLANMREIDGGMISTLDSLVAMEALVMYSFRARIREMTGMKISIEQHRKRIFDIEIENSTKLAETQTFELENIFGHLSIVGKGKGQALVQLHYLYGVDTDSELDVPPIPSFEFEIAARYSGRNNSYMTIKACQRWINVDETPSSGLTVVDIHLPSGYHIMQDTLIALVESRKVKHLRWALITDTKVLFFFNKLDSEMVCFSYRLERWYPVSNHSRHNQAMVYELYQPERFKTKLFEVFPLYSLDICEVCGSYQCPYCPFYSGTLKICVPLKVLFSAVLFLSLYTKCFHKTIYS